MEKIYINRKENRINSILIDHIVVGCNVIVIDASYMIKKNKDKVFGPQFKNSNHTKYELLTVTRINIPFKTEYGFTETKCLGYHNNCEIQNSDGIKFYCSHINIERYENVTNEITAINPDLEEHKNDLDIDNYDLIEEEYYKSL